MTKISSFLEKIGLFRRIGRSSARQAALIGLILVFMALFLNGDQYLHTHLGKFSTFLTPKPPKNLVFLVKTAKIEKKTRFQGEFTHDQSSRQERNKRLSWPQSSAINVEWKRLDLVGS